MGKYFGTDGVRGVANEELTPELAFRLGRCGGYVLIQKQTDPVVLVGRDTRASGEMLEAALTAGLLSVGARVERLGVVTTPGVAYLTKHSTAAAGVMISASHNPAEDNGIKFFGGDGFKLLDLEEAAIEALLDEETDRLPRPVGSAVGRSAEALDAVERYASFLSELLPEGLEGMRVVLDCAHGAAFSIAPDVFRRLGATVCVLGATPDGININQGLGSTHPEALQAEVLKQRADVGFAYDGDADRLICVDETGEVVDGDFCLSILALSLKEAGRLKGNAVAVTVMSNLGLHEAMQKAGIAVVQTAVGDRYVMEAMRQKGLVLGGEQSGHVILLDYNTTGDGILTSLQLAGVLRRKGEPLSQLKRCMRKYPQILQNVRLKDGRSKSLWEGDAEVQAEIQRAEQRLGEAGRVLVRPSGTEPLLRVMVEGPDEEVLHECVTGIAKAIERRFG